MEIANYTGNIQHKFINLMIEFENFGNKINCVQKTYEVAMRKLTDKQNLVKNVEKLKQLDIKSL